jgi:hypothetical protein
MAVLYRHIRLDKNEPFYVGIGKSVERAFATKSRNHHWKNIYKSTPIEIEILLEDLTIEDAFKKEAEFIKLYGRRDLGTGTLVNMTDGGYGTLNHSPEVLDSIRKKLTGRKISEEVKKKSAISRTGLKRTENTKILISKKLKGKTKSESHRLALSKSKLGIKTNRGTIVEQYNIAGRLINTFASQLDAAEFTKINKKCINNNLRNISKTAGGYIFKYKTKKYENRKS